MNSNRRGFTLVELLVVIGILAVLTAFVFPAIRSAMRKGKITETKTNIMALATAIKGYYGDFNAYPDLDAKSLHQPYVSDATDAGEVEKDNDMVMRLLTGRYYDPDEPDPNKVWKEDAVITTNKRWNGPYIELNEVKAYEIGDNLREGNVDHANNICYPDGYRRNLSNRAAYVDGWKSVTKYTYFLFKFPEPWLPDSQEEKRKPLFNRDSFDIYSAGPDGMCAYYDLSPSQYNVDDYKNYEFEGKKVNKDNVNNWD